MMRDCNGTVANDINDVNDTLEEPISETKPIYKEIVIVGNGPSGITLSFLLNGHWPFYNRKGHPDPMLSARLIECTHKSLLHQDLEFLAQGIEGRSKNPVSLLIDSMSHPGADMGLEWPSLLTWKKTKNNIEHVVLGRGQPGGAWQGIPENVLTISPGRWMSLPNMELKECREGRAPATAVFRYYNDYVEKYSLAKNMINDVTVTHIHPITGPGKRRARWRVITKSDNGIAPVEYECRHLILATGSSDRAGCLGVPGESHNFVTHDLKGLQQRLQGVSPAPPPPPRVLKSTDNLPDNRCSSLGSVSGGVNIIECLRRHRHKRRRSFSGVSSDVQFESPDKRFEERRKPVILVVGAGLSAADAILMARTHGFSVIHAFRGPTHTASLPSIMYPEYHEIYQLMQGEVKRADYRSLPGYQVREFAADNVVTLVDTSGADGEIAKVSVDVAAVLIGSQPDLSFIPAKLRHLGVDINKPVDCKANPILIDPYSYRCLRAPLGLYALGPLVGDNFVRFLQGGAVAVAGHIFKESSVYYAP